jgi:hypothetical protein
MSSHVTVSPSGVVRFSIESGTYAWDPCGPAGGRFRRDGAPGPVAGTGAEVEEFLHDAAWAPSGAQAVVQRVLLRHLVRIDEYESADDLAMTFLSWAADPEVLFSVLDTSTATDWDVRVSAQSCDPVNALLRSAVARGQLHVVNAGHLVGFCLDAMLAGELTLAQACDVLVLSLLLVDASLPDPGQASRECFGIAATVAASADVTVRGDLLDDAFCALTGLPAPTTVVLAGGTGAVPAPDGLAAVLLLGLALDAGGTTRLQVAEGMRRFAESGRSVAWTGSAMSPALAARTAQLAAAYRAMASMEGPRPRPSDLGRALRHLCELPDEQRTAEHFARLTAAAHLAVRRQLADDVVSSMLAVADAVAGHATPATMPRLLAYYSARS